MMKRRSIQVTAASGSSPGGEKGPRDGERGSPFSRTRSLHVAAETPRPPESANSPGRVNASMQELSEEDDDVEFLRLLEAQSDDKTRVATAIKQWDVPVQDYEALVAAAHAEIAKDPLKELLVIPPDDIQILTQKRTLRTVQPTVDAADPALPRHLQDTFDFYLRDFTLVKHKYSVRPFVETAEGRREEVRRCATIDASYEIDTLDTLKKKAESTSSVAGDARRPAVQPGQFTADTGDVLGPGEAEEVTVDLLSYQKGTTEKKLEADKQNDKIRSHLILTANCAEGELKGSDHVPDTTLPFARKPCRKFMVELRSLRVSTSVVEPFFIKLCLFDAKSRTRVSETVHVDLVNAAEHRAAFGTELVHAAPDPDGRTVSVVFSLHQPTPDVHLVVYLEKVTEGDPSHFADRFAGARPRQGSSPLLGAGDKITATLQRLSAYRQPLAFALLPLFSGYTLAVEGAKKAGKFQETTIEHFHRCDGGEHTLEAELEAALNSGAQKKGATLSKKGKMIGGSLDLRINEVGDNEITLNCIDPSLRKVHPFVEDKFRLPQERKYNAVLEAEEFYDIAEANSNNSAGGGGGVGGPNTGGNVIGGGGGGGSSASGSVSPATELVNNMYVYPLHLNYSKGNGKLRNLICRVQLAEVAAGEKQLRILPHMYAEDMRFAESAQTCMSYHNRSPSFYEEFKLKLPLVLHRRQFLLFRFFHISCKGSDPDKRGAAVETEAGFAYLPLQGEACIARNGIHELPVAASFSDDFWATEGGSNLKWLDNKKALFTIRLRTVSTIHSQEEGILRFQSFVSAKEGGAADAAEDAIAGLRTVSPAEISAHAPVLLDQLFRLLCSGASQEQMHTRAFDAIVGIVGTMMGETQRRSKILEDYCRYRFTVGDGARCHSQILKHLLRRVRTKEDSGARECLRYSWFFLEVVCRSMILSRSGASDAALVADMTDLLLEIAGEVRQRSKTGLNLARDLNETYANFLTSAVFLPRKVLFRLVRQYMDVVNTEANSSVLVQLKFDFLNILTAYEHYIPLCLPLASTFAPPFERITTLEKDYGQRHFLSSLLLAEVGRTMESRLEDARLKALITLENLLRKHDDRGVPRRTLARIHNLYLPFLAMATSWAARILTPSRPVAGGKVAIAGAEANRTPFSDKEKKIIYLIFLNIVKHVEPNILVYWLEKGGPSNFAVFCRLLGASAAFLEYPGAAKLSERLAANLGRSARDKEKTKRALENMYRMGGGAASMRDKGRMMRQKSLTVTTATEAADGGPGEEGSESAVSALASPTESVGDRTVRSAFAGGATSKVAHSELEFFQMIMLEAVMGGEVALIVLDTFDRLAGRAHAQLHDPLTGPEDAERYKGYVDRLFSLLCSVSSRNLSELVRIFLLRSIKQFVCAFSPYIFRNVDPRFGRLCPDLCRLVLNATASSQPAVRRHGAALLYLLLQRNGEEAKGSIGKVKVHTTVALSKLEIGDDAWLRRSLATAKRFAELDRGAAPAFRLKVGELVDSLFGILRDSVKIQAHRDDPEMLQDMTLRIANGYRNAPDLRLATLENLARQHIFHGNNAEAAVCYVHSAALVSDFLALTAQQRMGGPAHAAAFSRCSANVTEDGTGLQADFTPGEDGICQSASFSEAGLVALMELALPLLNRAQLYETLNELYKLVLPVYERGRLFEKLAAAHLELSNAFKEVHLTQKNGRRILGTYFRVGFYGAGFEVLDGKEFIYKEKKITQLSEICARLTAVYRKRFDANFVLVQDSAKFDPAKTEPGKAYCQVTYVEPFWSPDELASRVTYFERWNGLRRFSFDMPFTRSGKAHGDVASQYMRRTVVTVEKSFPYLKKRLLVVHREEVELNPLEVSIGQIAERCAKLQQAINAEPADPKSLQMLLQGSVRLQVNAGPLEIASAFLRKPPPPEYLEVRVEKLRQCFSEFYTLCGVALALNKTLIKEDQAQYQADLEQGYEEMRVQLKAYLPLGSTSSLHSDGGGATAVDAVLNFIGQSASSAALLPAAASSAAAQGMSGGASGKPGSADAKPAGPTSDIAKFFYDLV